MRLALKTVLCGLYRYCGLFSAQEWLYHWRGRSSASILLFHRVTDDIPPDGLTVSCARFRSLCRLLTRRFRVVPLGEMFRLARGGAALPRRTVAITFDDCYRDNLAAARVLAEYGLPATFFVPTAFVGTDHQFPWDRSHKPLPNLTWNDLQEIHGLGFEIGSHTATHPDLGAVAAEQAEREFVESKEVLEQRLGGRVRWFAYPFGGVNNFRADWLPLLKRAGYEGCVSGYGGLIHRGMEASVLPRVPVPSFPSNLLLEIHLSDCLRGYYGLKRRLGLSELHLASWECTHGSSPSPTAAPASGSPCELGVHSR
jgi:peptidoglycan/xylan/chitin deacetylase (PgdA/CDA1 family)